MPLEDDSVSEQTADVTPTQQTLVQRLVLGFLNATVFYYVAIKPSYQMASFMEDDVILFTFVRNLILIIAAYAVTSKVLFKQR